MNKFRSTVRLALLTSGMLRAAQAQARIRGRDHVLPDDVQALARPVLAHRLVLGPEHFGSAADAVIGEALGALRAL